MAAIACPCAASHARPQLASQFWCPLPASFPCSQNHISFRCSYRRRRSTRCTSDDSSSGKKEEEQQQLPDLIKLLGRSLWGQGLPPGALVGSVRSAWNTGWLVMMKQLAPSDARGGYQRPDSKFRNRPSRPSAPGRYHLYVSLTCPWAHRTAIVHALKGLHDAVPLSVAVPSGTGTWVFDPQTNHHMHAAQGDLVPTIDRANRCLRLLDVYKLRKHGYDGRATVPMLWDSVEKEVVNNESSDIIDILNSDFNDLARNPELDLAPQHLISEIDKWNNMIYPKVNNGVYRCGFAQGQEVYNVAVEDVFSTLDLLDEHLRFSRYLCGSQLTLADVRLFTTLYRFDAVYYNLFKCSKRKIIEFANLYGYLRDLYQVPGIASTCDMPTIMDGYYRVLFPLNPGAITPVIPLGSEASSLMLKHDRECLSSSTKTPAML